MESFTDMEMKNEVIDGGQIALAVSSFFTIALGGLCIGILVGFLTALFTKAQCARNAQKSAEMIKKWVYGKFNNVFIFILCQIISIFDDYIKFSQRCIA